jgi:uncharacterized protein (TIGR02646 family)
MRYIAENEILKVLDGEWCSEAKQKIEALEKMTSDERQKAIGNSREVWAEVKDKLASCSSGKCWYCESRETRSDNTVDHFRPKGRVAECADHEGYWWLAFDWHNFRFSCTFCNSRRRDKETGTSGGKQDHFPLLDESTRAKTPSDDITNERPCLLDPLCATDPQLLWFQDDGAAIPKYAEVEAEELYLRASKSIELFHLNHTKAKERRKIIGNDIASAVRIIEKYFPRYIQADRDAETLVRREFEKLHEMISPAAEFSASARAYLRGQRGSGREWIDEVLQQA